MAEVLIDACVTRLRALLVEKNRTQNLIITVKGKWGIGKTYLWKNLLDEIPKTDRRKGKTAYVSLFGVTSLEDLKARITAASYLDTIGDTIKWSAKTSKWFKRLGGLGLSDIRGIPLSALNAIAYNTVKDTLICFDDLERIGEGLELGDFFGLITQLRDEKMCEVVVLLNSGQLDKNRDAFEAAQDKSIDVQLTLISAWQHAFSAVWSNSDGSLITETVRECVESLNITNIRINQRIARWLDWLTDSIEGYRPEVQDYVARSLVLLIWGYYDKENSPGYKYVRRPESDFHLAIQDELVNKGSASEDESRWFRILREYPYMPDHSIHAALAEIIESGVWDETELAEHLTSLEARYVREEERKHRAQAWDLYTESFNDNQNHFIERLYRTSSAALQFLEIREINSDVMMLRRLGAMQHADNLLDAFVDNMSDDEQHQRRIDEFKRERRFTMFDPSVQSRILPLLARKSAPASVNAVFSIGERVYTEQEKNYLCQLTEDQIYKHLKGLTGHDLYKATDTAIGLLSGDRAGGPPLKVACAILEALKRIANESAINKARMETVFRIDPNAISLSIQCSDDEIDEATAPSPDSPAASA
ncbi:MAG: hypothetical protein RhofKO_04680 [Rhodothermales bacterium]